MFYVIEQLFYLFSGETMVFMSNLMRNPVAQIKLFFTIGSLVKNPNELDRVTKIVDLLDKLKTEADSIAFTDEMKMHPHGQWALEQKPSIGTLNPSELLKLPETTLGGSYGRFMLARGLSQASFPQFKIRTDMDWILAHFYETHDLWHVITGLDTDIPGELALQSFYLAQTRSYLPFFVIAALLLNTAIYSYEQKNQRLQAIADGWNLGKKAKNLFGINWNNYLTKDLAQVRLEFRIIEKEMAGVS
jgi:ubiquinone biosynthesis protein COQ4